MANDLSSLEPLADYLAPRFGNVYDFAEVPDEGGVYRQVWTPELKTAVERYLAHEISDDNFAAFLENLDHAVPPGNREDQSEFVVSNAQAWEIAYACHLAALVAVTRLDQIIGHLDAWPAADLQEDVGAWLDANVSEVELGELAAVTGTPERDPTTPWYAPVPTGWHLTEKLTPPELLETWHRVIGPAESDLTDEKWQLLVGVLPKRKQGFGSRQRSEQELRALRAAFDGMRYRAANGTSWARIPQRYGAFAGLVKFFV